jgi:hypothetical protein
MLDVRCGTSNPDECVLKIRYYLFPLSPVTSSGSYLTIRAVFKFIDGSDLGLAKMASAASYVKDDQGIFGVKTRVLRYWKLHNRLRYIC